MPKAFSEQEKLIITERLIDRGGKLFATHGLKKTNVDELAAAAGISKGAFYIFYESKEALFMDVTERAEQQFRQVILASIDEPGPTPRARLLSVLRKAFTLWKTIPVLQVFTTIDFDLLAQRLPAEKLQEHMSNDQAFVQELVQRCREAGIPIQAPIEQISSLLYILVFAELHQDDLGPDRLAEGIEVLLELVAAFCLGEIQLESIPMISNRR
jgi:AcrR family transcriptional regulator